MARKRTAHVPAGYSNGGQFTSPRANPPRRAKTGPLTKGYDNLRNLEQMPEMRPVDKNKNAVKLAEARNTPRMRKLGAKLANAYAELQIARRSGDKKRIAAWERETSKREEAYLDAYREEAKARGARVPKTRKERTAEAAEVEARAQARRDKEGRRIEARREAAVSRSVYPKLVEAQRAQQAHGRGETGRTTVNRRFAEHEEAFQASVARRMGEEKPTRARKAPAPKAPAEPKARTPRKRKPAGRVGPITKPLRRVTKKQVLDAMAAYDRGDRSGPDPDALIRQYDAQAAARRGPKVTKPRR